MGLSAHRVVVVVVLHHPGNPGMKQITEGLFKCKLFNLEDSRTQTLGLRRIRSYLVIKMLLKKHRDWADFSPWKPRSNSHL